MGRAHVSFELEVQSRVETDEHPLLIEGNLVNLTKSVGETAIFHCKVMSETVPLIQWLKKTEKNAMPDDPAEAKHTHLIDKDGNYFRSLQANGAIESANGAHQSRLVIEQVKSTDAGHYVCLAASVKGYSIKSAYLTVEGSDYEADNNVDATYDMSELEASPKLDRIERTQLPEVVLWLSASALLFITFIMIFACSHRATPTIVLPNPCKNNSCPNVAIAESVISQALRSTRTSYDPDMFTRWIYEQNALFHSIQDTTTVDSIITSEICPKKGQRLRAYGKAASEVTTYSLPASTMYNSERDASASDVGRTARPNTPATASNRIDSLNSGLASITESGNEIRI
ncbi:Fibroblast growth factor receptor-like 1 [Halotydeus destructor]|nr:Fibroblast growth factor receptor-like 1 [Halotydeus destructor]